MTQMCLLTNKRAGSWLGCLCAAYLAGCGSSEPGPGNVESTLGGSAATNGGNPSGNGGAVNTSAGGKNVGGTVSGSSAGGSPAAGGRAESGGASVGGAAAGGVGTGGSSTGSTSAGGTTVAASGGRANGGTNAGGTAAGGKASGGANGGGAPVGGSAAGGAASGGKASAGGAAAGGKASGGTSAGGAAAGGTSAGGNSAGGTSAGGSAASTLCPAGITQTISVAKDGSGQFSTVQAAINSIASTSTEHIRIDIKAGTYNEKITIAGRTNLCLVGDAASTTILTYNDSNGSVGSTSGSASVYVSANDFSATRLTFQNSYGAGSQAVALRTTGQRQQFLDCRFVGYQDTLYVHSGTQYFRNCYVQGNTDYVFGGATAILQNCEVRNVQSGSAVAAPNTASTTAYGIVFLGGQFTAASGVSNVALARPWGADGAAAFLNASLGGHIASAGFVAMSGNDPANARFSEYQSTGSGANASARSSYQMTATKAAEYTIAKIYGGAWTPSYSQ